MMYQCFCSDNNSSVVDLRQYRSLLYLISYGIPYLYVLVMQEVDIVFKGYYSVSCDLFINNCLSMFEKCIFSCFSLLFFNKGFEFYNLNILPTILLCY